MTNHASHAITRALKESIIFEDADKADTVLSDITNKTDLANILGADMIQDTLRQMAIFSIDFVQNGNQFGKILQKILSISLTCNDLSLLERMLVNEKYYDNYAFLRRDMKTIVLLSEIKKRLQETQNALVAA